MIGERGARGPRRRAPRPGRRPARRRQPLGGGGRRSPPAASRVDGEVATSGKVRLAEGALVEVDPTAIPRTGAARPPSRRSSFDVVHADDAVIVVDKPAGAGRPPRRRQPRRHPRQRAAAPGSPSWPASATRRARASSTASTPAARACSSSPARPRPPPTLVAPVRRPHRRPALRRRGVGAPRRAARHRRRPDRPRPRRPAADGRGRRRASRRGPSTRSSSASTPRPTLARLRAGWRPGAPTRSASTWRPSATRSSATPPTASGARRSGSTRPFLHAAELSFDHPVTGERVTFHSPLARRPRRASSPPALA